MNSLKSNANLYRIYCKFRNRYMISFFVSLFLMIFGFLLAIVRGDLFEIAIIIFIIALTSLIVFAILWPVKCHGAKKSIAEFTPQQLMIINNEMAVNPVYEHFVVTSQAVVNTSGGFGLVPVSNILWVYKQVTTTRMYGIVPVAKSSVLNICGRDQRIYIFNIKNKSQVVEFLQNELLKYRLDIIFGFDGNLSNMFDKDINRLIGIAYECGQRRLQNMQPIS